MKICCIFLYVLIIYYFLCPLFSSLSLLYCFLYWLYQFLNLFFFKKNSDSWIWACQVFLITKNFFSHIKQLRLVNLSFVCFLFLEVKSSNFNVILHFLLSFTIFCCHSFYFLLYFNNFYGSFSWENVFVCSTSSGFFLG